MEEANLHLVFYLLGRTVPLQLNRDDEQCGSLRGGRLAQSEVCGSLSQRSGDACISGVYTEGCWLPVAQRFHPHYEEFDPGSGRTLAACLMHASRTQSLR